MSEAIELIWAKLPSFPQHYHEADNDALVAFLSYVPKIVFPVIRPYWEGYIFYQDRKVALYKVEVIEALLNETYIIDIDGTRIEKPVSGYPGLLMINKLINVCYQSHNSLIAKMAFKQRQLLIYSHVKKDLWALFEPSDVIEVQEPEQYKSGTWTTVKANRHEREFDFELMKGQLHYEEHRKDDKGQPIVHHRLAKLKNLDDIEKLMKLVTEYKKYGRTIESFYEFDMHSVWVEGFKLETFEPKKSNGLSTTQPQDSVGQNKTDTHQNTHTNDDTDNDIENILNF